MTDESGRPLLDQVDDEGVTLRERLSESQGQLDRMRSDPRLADSPLAGIFDAIEAALATGTESGTDEPTRADELPPPGH